VVSLGPLVERLCDPMQRMPDAALIRLEWDHLALGPAGERLRWSAPDGRCSPAGFTVWVRSPDAVSAEVVTSARQLPRRGSVQQGA
jgi:hypothetical protein